MEKRKRALIGLLLLAAVIIAVVALFATDVARWLEPSQEAVVYFDEPLGGLSAGAPVTFRGIEIGSVAEVKIVGDVETLMAETGVVLRLHPARLPFHDPDDARAKWINIEWLVEEGLRAQITLNSIITRELAIDLNFRPEIEAQFRNQASQPPEIPSAPSGLMEAQSALTEFPWQQAMDSVLNTLTALESLTESLAEEFEGIGDKAHATLDESIALLSTSRQAVEAGSKDLDEILLRATQAMNSVEQIAAEMETMMQPRSPERDDLDRALRDLSSAATALRRFAEDLEQNPSMLIFDRDEAEP